MNQHEYDDLSFNSQWLVEGNRRMLVGGDLWHFVHGQTPVLRQVKIDTWPELPVMVSGFGHMTVHIVPTTYCFEPVLVATMGGDWIGYEVTVRGEGKNED